VGNEIASQLGRVAVEGKEDRDSRSEESDVDGIDGADDLILDSGLSKED